MSPTRSTLLAGLAAWALPALAGLALLLTPAPTLTGHTPAVAAVDRLDTSDRPVEPLPRFGVSDLPRGGQ